MTRVQRGIAFAAAFLIFGGCGAHTLVEDGSAVDASDSTEAPISAPPETPTSTPTQTPPETVTATQPGTGSPIPLPVTTPPSDSVSLIVPLFDPFGFPLLGLTDTPDLLSMFSDFLILDLVNPPGRGGLVDNYTYLELLCLEGNDPDFVCRERYGP
jgi:hypothetical protein